MGFSGGGSNILKPHSHDGRVVQDGGELDFNNITQANSSAGQIFYSNGTALQQLAYPGVPAGETLTAVAASTSPSWATAAGGSANVENHLTADFSTTSGTMVEFMDITLPTIAGGKCMICFSGCASRSGSGGIEAQLFDDNSGGDVFMPGTLRQSEVSSTNERWALPTQAIADALGQDITVYCKTGGNTLLWKGGTASDSFCTNITALGA